MLWLDLLLSAPDAPWSPPKWLPVAVGIGTGNEPSEDELMDAIFEQADKTGIPYSKAFKPVLKQGKKNTNEYVDGKTDLLNDILHDSANGDSGEAKRRAKRQAEADGE